MLNPRDPDQEAVGDIAPRLEQQLDAPAREWLRQALAEAEAQPQKSTWELHFASAGRQCGRAAALDARVLLLHSAGPDTVTLTRLYHQGTAAERAAVLRALPHMAVGKTPDAVPLVEDALRANDTTLIRAAVGRYAAAHLDRHGWRHAVLKCLFTGVPVRSVNDLARRARGDAELARMLRDFAHERTAAGRSVPEDLHHVLELALESAPAHPPEEF
ncbi:EboA domain-containing protein [Streptomyces albidus (ex Kaewkla and Franco 2022)]|uniref:EboA domain-containing protein n=1 Tax=Streptomyces albidus (ex Kaewkla and Franco 2022) TaxID=722709 RepID=UPI003AF32990